MSNFPTAAVTTKFGQVHAWATSADHVGFRTDRREDAITINGVPYTFRVDFHRIGTEQDERARSRGRQMFGNEVWAVDLYEGVSSGRADDNHYYDRPSPAAFRKIREVLLPELLAWMSTPEGEAMIKEADNQRFSADLRAAEQAVINAEENLQAAKDRLADLRGQSITREAKR